MSAVIYYFSGTGNSLFVASDLAIKLNARLISIPSIIENEKIVVEPDRVIEPHCCICGLSALFSE